MRIAAKIGLVIALFTLCVFNSALATELGFKAGLLASYSGEFDEVPSEYDRELQFNSALESIGTPMSIFILHKGVKISYLHYEIYSQKELPANTAGTNRGEADGTILIRNDVFSVGYQRELLALPYDIQVFAGADLALFKSSMNVQISSHDAVNRTGYSMGSNARSEPEISFGMILSAGVKKYIENVFISADMTYINKSINFERLPSYREQVKVDVGGTIFSVGAGLTF